MSTQSIAAAIFEKGKGILAADESISTMDKRLTEAGIEPVEHNRLLWRNLLFSTPYIEKYISGIILSEDILDSRAPDGQPFPEMIREQKIQCGLKVDKGLEKLDTGIQEEYYTKGLDTLTEQLEKAKKAGCTFTKWRSVFSIGNGRPSAECMQRNIEDMAAYAKQVSMAGLVPIVEPEILREGAHPITKTHEVCTDILNKLVKEMTMQEIDMAGTIFKIAFVTQGADGEEPHPHTVGQATAILIEETIPSTVGGVVFLSGGLSTEYTNTYLGSAVKERGIRNLSTPLTFSFGRSLQRSAILAWEGLDANTVKAQEVFQEDMVAASKMLIENG